MAVQNFDEGVLFDSFLSTSRYFIDPCKLFCEENFFCSFQNLPSKAALLQ